MLHRSRHRTRPMSRLRVEQLEDRCVPANFVPVLTSLHAELTSATGTLVRLTGSFSDTDLTDPHSVIIDWNDSAAAQKLTLTGGARTFQSDHFYPSRQSAIASIRSIGVIVTDQAFADQVVASSGSFDNSDYRKPNSALGEPTRFTNPSHQYGGAVTPFSAPWAGDEIFALEQGETITVQFPVRVYDNPSAQHSGADFLVFGNAFYNFDFNTLRATGGVFAEPGVIEVSQDGVTFFAITNAFADTAFPTNGYQNPDGPFDLPPAQPILSDFGLPVGLSFDETGLTLRQIVDAYNGSGGGTPIDISSTGLEWIQYVRVQGAAGGVEIDAFSVVNPLPQPVLVGNLNLADVDEALGLYVDKTGVFQTGAGTGVKWLRSSVPNLHGNTWYFLRENGDLLAWNGARDANGNKLARGKIAFRLDPQVFIHPGMLFDASEANLIAADAAVAQQLDETRGLFVGVSGFRNGVNGPNVKWLRGTHNAFGNTWYFINRDGDFFAWNGKPGATGTLLHDFDAQLFLDPHLLHDASAAALTSTDAAQAQDFDERFGLFIDAAGVFPNLQRNDTKWLRGQSNTFANPWYFIRDSGAFVEWNGTKNAAGKRIADGRVLHDFDSQLFLDPHLLFNAAQSTLSAGDTVQARQYQATLGLFVDALGFFGNVHDTSAKWLRGQPNQFGATWYFIRPNGELVAWNNRRDVSGRKIASGTVLYTFDPQVFLNPEPLL